MADDEQNLVDIDIMYNDNRAEQVIAIMIFFGNLSSQMAASLQKENTSLYNNYTTIWKIFSNRRDYYLWWYLGYGGFQAILVILFMITFSLMVARASHCIHINMLG